MANDMDYKSALLLAERKKALVAEGSLYRLGFTNAKQLAASSLQAESLVKSALHHVGVAAFAALRNGTGLKASTLQTLLPLLISGVSALSKRSLIKPLLRSMVAISVLGTIATVLTKRKKTRRENTETENK